MIIGAGDDGDRASVPLAGVEDAGGEGRPVDPWQLLFLERGGCFLVAAARFSFFENPSRHFHNSSQLWLTHGFLGTNIIGSARYVLLR
jgi:hypothetical protein